MTSVSLELDLISYLPSALSLSKFKFLSLNLSLFECAAIRLSLLNLALGFSMTWESVTDEKEERGTDVTVKGR